MKRRLDIDVERQAPGCPERQEYYNELTRDILIAVEMENLFFNNLREEMRAMALLEFKDKNPNA